jgi:hypothetical protein
VRGTKTVLLPSIYQNWTLQNAMICLLIRDNNDYQFNNLFFNCGVGITKWIYKVDTLEYQMAEPGTLLGNGFQT